MSKTFTISSSAYLRLQALRAELHEKHRVLGQLMADFETKKQQQIEAIRVAEDRLKQTIETLGATFCTEPGNYELVGDQFKERE